MRKVGRERNNEWKRNDEKIKMRKAGWERKKERERKKKGSLRKVWQERNNE